MKESTCFTLLNFEPPEDPTWRQDELRKGTVPSINEMLDYIIEARQRWKKISESNSSSDNRIASAVEKLEVLFVYHTCQQEDVGIANEVVIRQIIEDWRDGKCRDNSENHESSAYQETVNFYTAYKMLQDLGRKEAESDVDLRGLLEVDSYILATHERLMRGLSMKTRGGLFSTEVRQTIAEGELHQYPTFETHDEARDAVLRIIDRYNMLCFSIRDQESHNEKAFVRNIFKCTIWLFHELLSLHPFGDGNGRLCRLILNYAISVIVPFPVPLRDIFRSSRDAYLSAVIAPRKSDGRPTDLMGLLVESTYDGWKTFLDDFKELEVVKSADVFPLSGKQRERQPTQNLLTGEQTSSSLCRSSDLQSCTVSLTKFKMIEVMIILKQKIRKVISELAKTLTYGFEVAVSECWFWHYMSAINRKYPEVLIHTIIYPISSAAFSTTLPITSDLSSHSRPCETQCSAEEILPAFLSGSMFALVVQQVSSVTSTGPKIKAWEFLSVFCPPPQPARCRNIYTDASYVSEDTKFETL